MKMRESKAFTIIEVLIAIIILAGSLVVLISLEGAAIARSINDRQHFYASLAARSIMSMIELEKELEDQETVKPLLELLEDYNALSEIDDRTRAIYADMEAALIVQEMDLSALLGMGSMPPAATGNSEEETPSLKLKKLGLGIRWGQGEEQSINIHYARTQ